MRKVTRLFLAALTDFSRNNCPYMAAGIAYWALFSLFPLTLAGLAILGFMYPTPVQQGRLVEGLVQVVPVSTDYLAGVVDDVAQARGPLGILAILGLLWTGTAVFSAARKGINHVWHVGQPPHFLVERAIDLVMLLGVGVLAFLEVAFATNLFGLSTVAKAPAWLAGGLVAKVLLETGGLVATFGVFLLLYRYVPNTRVAWGDVWLGAATGAVLFQGVRVGFTWFVASFGSFNLVYGSLSALMAVLVWAYLSAMALMWGAQVCFIYSHLLGTSAGQALPAYLMPRPAANPARPRGLLGPLVTVLRWLLPPRGGAS